MENHWPPQNHMDQPTHVDGHDHGDFSSNPVPSLPEIALMDFLDLKMLTGLYNLNGSAFVQSLSGR
jgi:hypothetical protein